MGELHFSFGEIDQSNQNPSESVQTKPVEQESIKISEEAREQDRLSILAEELEDLKLSDPLAYERLIGIGELGDGGEA